MVTIKEIAQECKLSTTAVSKALRNEPDISSETIVRVKKVAKEMGYIKNPAAVRLKTNRSYNFGVLLEDGTHSGLTHDFFANVLNSFINTSREHGFTVSFIGDKLGKNKLTYKEYVETQGCDGIFILVHTEYEEPKVQELVRSGIPLVMLDYKHINCSSVRSDNEYAMAEMVEYAYKMGHRKIAFVHGEDTLVTRIRLASFYSVCEKLGIEVPDEYVREGIFHDTNSAEQITYELLDLDEPPTFIFYQDDFAFLGARNAFEKRNLEVPRDISVAGFDGIMMSQVIRPALMTWKQNTHQIGVEAANLLYSAVEKPKNYIARELEIRGEFLKGDSVLDLNKNI